MPDTHRLSLYLKVKYWLPRDPKAYQGILFHLSPENLSFVTNRSVPEDLKFRLAICSPQDSGESCSPQMCVKSTRVESNRNGYLVSAYFIAEEEMAEADDRRNNTRHPVYLKAELALHPTAQRQTCRIVDISRSGVRFELPHPLDVGDTIYMTIHGSPHGPFRRNVEAVAEVARSRHRGQSVYEMGATFLRAGAKIERAPGGE